MVFKPFSHLARHSFAKTFPHGYAQSLVAGAQSSYASSTTPFGPFGNHSAPRFHKSGTSQLQNAFQSTPPHSNSQSKAGSYDATEGSSDGGLDAYYAAWQKHQGSEEKEWKQFQFTKRIGWKAPTALPEGKSKDREDVGLRPDVLLSRSGLDRSCSASAVENIKRAESDVAEAAAIARVDEAIAIEIDDLQQPTDAVKNAEITPTTSTEKTTQPLERLAISAQTLSSSGNNTPACSLTGELESRPFVDHIKALSESERYAEIPPVFESMLRRGVRPTVEAYNGLLQAAIHLPLAKHQVVPKALDVYTDMLRRKVMPDTATYTVLVELLSKRALDVSKMKKKLEKSRLRHGGMQKAGQFMLRSQEAEYDILLEDDALTNAIKLFESYANTSAESAFSANTYNLLITACAAHGEVDHMIRIYSHMEASKVVPYATIFPPMIEAFAKSGDLRSSVECYNEYKTLAIADDNGTFVIIQRRDHEVYAAVVKAYAMCGKMFGAHKFFGKVVDSVVEAKMPIEQVQTFKDKIFLDAFVQAYIENGNLTGAVDVITEKNLSLSSRAKAMTEICASAADNNVVGVAIKTFNEIPTDADSSLSGITAMLAMHIRQGDVESARLIWSTMTAMEKPSQAFIEPTAMYAVALIGSGFVDEGLMQARQSFSRIRSAINPSNNRSDITEQIDECIEFIGSYLAEKGIFPAAQAGMNFMWAMIENGGLVGPVAEHLLAGLSQGDMSKLSWQDLNLALQVEAGIVSSSQAALDTAHIARFADLFDTALAARMPFDKRTSTLIERCLRVIGDRRQDLVSKWQVAHQPVVHQDLKQVEAISHAASTPATSVSYNDTFDPYASSTDFRGSSIISDELERYNSSNGANLNEALIRFRNMRRAGRHPRYIIYAKLIAAAAKDGRANLIHDILSMARQDVPLLVQYRVVRHGWASILDAMTGACLTLGNRSLAGKFHQELLDIGTAPTSNTYGLYITTLKESIKTFDEATEAVKIFHRAQSEGVEPSSFLYNALIGKLGKARRIDDCLYYFADMRSRGIRPTSVTYGTIVNALCRVSDERFAQELFDEMESMPNYKPRPAPYNSLMQFFLVTKRDSSKVLEYYNRMRKRSIQPTMHTYKLLIDTYATLDPIDMTAAEGVLDMIRASGQRPEAVHYSSLIHAKGCALHDMTGARKTFDDVLANTGIRPQACLYQALFECMVANHCVRETESILKDMSARGVEMTPYIANTLIHGWAMEKSITQSKAIYEIIGKDKREPSTYEAMTRAYLAVEDRDGASDVVHEMLSRGYPSAVSGKILELLGYGMSRSSSVIPPFTPTSEATMSF